MDLSSRVPMMDLDEAMEVYKDLSLASDLDLKDAFTVFSEHLLQGRNWDFLEKKLKNDLLQRLTFCLLNVTDELILLFLKEKFQKIFKKMVAEEINNKDLKIIQEEKQLVINILEDTFKKYCRWGNANSEEGWEECFYHIDKQDLLSYFLKLKDMLGNDLLPTLEDSIFKLMDALKLAGDEFIFEFYKDRLLKEKEAISLCYGHAINEGISRIFFSERYSLKVKKFLISKLNSHRKEIGLLLFLLFDKFPDSLRDNYSELIYEYLRLEIPETKKKILMCFEQSEVFPSKTKLEIAMEIRNLLSNFFAFDLRGDPSERVIKRYLKYFLRNRKKFESKFKNFEAESNEYFEHGQCENCGTYRSNESGMHSVLENLRGFLGFERPAPLITLLLLSNSYITSPKKATEYLFLLSKKIRKQDFTLFIRPPSYHKYQSANSQLNDHSNLGNFPLGQKILKKDPYQFCNIEKICFLRFLADMGLNGDVISKRISVLMGRDEERIPF